MDKKICIFFYCTTIFFLHIPVIFAAPFQVEDTAYGVITSTELDEAWDQDTWLHVGDRVRVDWHFRWYAGDDFSFDYILSIETGSGDFVYSNGGMHNAWGTLLSYDEVTGSFDFWQADADNMHELAPRSLDTNLYPNGEIGYGGDVVYGGKDMSISDIFSDHYVLTGNFRGLARLFNPDLVRELQYNFSLEATPTPVPEPGSCLLFAAGLIGFIHWRKYREMFCWLHNC